MPRRKRLAVSPVVKRNTKICRNDSAGDDADDSWSHEDGSEDGENDKEYKPDTDEDGSKRNDSSAPEDVLGEECFSPKTTIIPYNGLRPLGGIEYSDTRVHTNTLLYLNDLRTNNDRAWFKSKKATAAKYTVIC